MADHISDTRLESLLREALAAEVADLPLTVRPGQILDRAATRRSALSRSRLRLLIWGQTDGGLRSLSVAAAAAAIFVVVAVVVVSLPRSLESPAAPLPTSPDAWSRVVIDAGFEESVVSLAAGPHGLLAAVGEGDESRLYVSADGRDWTRVQADQLPPVGRNGAALVATDQGFLIVGTDVFASDDGLSWRPIAGRADDPDLRQGTPLAAAAAGPGLVAVGSDNKAWYSTDGTDWTLAEVPPPPGEPSQLERPLDRTQAQGVVELSGVAVAGRDLVAWGTSTWGHDDGLSTSVPVLWASSDGLSWTSVAPPQPTRYATVAGGPNGFVLQDGGAVWLSADGRSWERVAEDAFGSSRWPALQNDDGNQVHMYLSSITAGAAGYIAVGTDGLCLLHCSSAETVIWTSPDGRTWSRLPNDDLFRAPTGAGANLAVASQSGFIVGGEHDGKPAIWISGTPPASPSPSEPAAPSASPIPVAGPGGVWIPTGSMVTPRYDHAAVRLLDGRVLIVGGTDRLESRTGPELTSAELYDPATGIWSATGNMLRHREGFPAILLRDGRVLVGVGDDPTSRRDIRGAEVYDPASGTWTATGQMVRGADGIGDTAAVLQDGKVLVAGQNPAQLYDPDSGTWTATGTMVTPRYNHAATHLPDGRVLVVGGDVPPDRPTESAELYDPNTGTWTATASLSAIGHVHPVAVLLTDGTVLVVRGPSAELYDPTTGTWAARTMPTEGGSPRALLSNDSVLMTGGRDACTAAALYDPGTGSLTTASSMLRCGDHSSFTLLDDGTVLVAGGSDCNGDGVCVANGAAALYVPAGVSLPPLPAFASPPPPVFPDPTPTPTPLPPAAGPVPPNARSWKVTVDNKSSEPATLFVAEEDEGGKFRLVGSATPNVVPAGATVKVTFLFPAKGGPDDGWIFVNPRPGEGGSLVSAADIGIPGKILIQEGGQAGWLSQ